MSEFQASSTSVCSAVGVCVFFYCFLFVCVFECIATGATGGAVGVGAKQVDVFV